MSNNEISLLFLCQIILIDERTFDLFRPYLRTYFWLGHGSSCSWARMIWSAIGASVGRATAFRFWAAWSLLWPYASSRIWTLSTSTRIVWSRWRSVAGTIPFWAWSPRFDASNSSYSYLRLAWPVIWHLPSSAIPRRHATTLPLTSLSYRYVLWFRFILAYRYVKLLKRKCMFAILIKIVCYFVLRNTVSSLRNNCSLMFGWFGRISLELYVCSYHIWLSADASGILVLLPRYPVLNMLITSFIFICVAHELNRITKALSPYAVPNNWRSCLRNLFSFILILMPIAINYGYIWFILCYNKKFLIYIHTYIYTYIK